MSRPIVVVVVSVVAGFLPVVHRQGQNAEAAIATNAIATNAIATNAIATNAIATNAIATNALGTNWADGVATVTDGTIKGALEEPNAQIFMEYLVSCALGPKQSLKWTSSATAGLTKTWTGNLGLCTGWWNGKPTQDCKERVSACILARNNPFGVSVPLSMRGDETGTRPISLTSNVPAWPKRWRTINDVNSSKACASDIPGPRDCDWTNVGVGRCDPKSPVQVEIGAGCQQLGSARGDTMLRVCRRINFCDDLLDEIVKQNDDECQKAPFVSFPCPVEGFFAVLHANHKSGTTPGGKVDIRHGKLRSSEAQVFIWREGAFYGDIFDPTAINPRKRQIRFNPRARRVEQQIQPRFNGPDAPDTDNNNWGPVQEPDRFQGVVFKKMWACSSKNWKRDDAYYQMRACAGPNTNCAADYAGVCDGVCQTDDAPPVSRDYDYDGCRDKPGTTIWQHPITTFINQPCDLADKPKARHCETTSEWPTPRPPEDDKGFPKNEQASHKDTDSHKDKQASHKDDKHKDDGEKDISARPHPTPLPR